MAEDDRNFAAYRFDKRWFGLTAARDSRRWYTALIYAVLPSIRHRANDAQAPGSCWGYTLIREKHTMWNRITCGRQDHRFTHHAPCPDYANSSYARYSTTLPKEGVIENM